MSEAGKVSLPVTVARLPEEAIAELDERISELCNKEAGDFEEDAELLSDDMLGTFNLLTIGYDAAWTEVERLSAALEEAQQQLDEMTVNAVGWKEQYIAEWAKRSVLERELAEAQQSLARKQLYIEKLEYSREYAQKAADDISKEKDLELFEARQTIARQREALETL